MNEFSGLVLMTAFGKALTSQLAPNHPPSFYTMWQNFRGPFDWCGSRLKCQTKLAITVTTTTTVRGNYETNLYRNQINKVKIIMTSRVTTAGELEFND